MAYVLFLKREHGGQAADSPGSNALQNMGPILRPLNGLPRATLCTSDSVTDPLLNEPAHACSCLILYFETQGDLERACESQHGLTALLRCEPFQGWREGEVTYQAMQEHGFPAAQDFLGAECRGYGYLVGYEGDPTDTAAWVAEYMENHVALMRRLPRIRHIGVFTRLQSVCGVPMMGAPQNWMPRNIACFATRQDMDMALNSAARAALRAHRSGMEPHGGDSEHVPVLFHSMRV